MSGSSAIAGFRPHRSRRATLPQWALQDGPEADESSVPGLMEDRFGQWEGGQDRLEAQLTRPFWLRLPSTFRHSLTTQSLNTRQGSIVEDHTETGSDPAGPDRANDAARAQEHASDAAQPPKRPLSRGPSRVGCPTKPVRSIPSSTSWPCHVHITVRVFPVRRTPRDLLALMMKAAL